MSLPYYLQFALGLKPEKLGQEHHPLPNVSLHVLLHQVESNPTTDLTFHWVFNTTGETSELHSPAVRVEGRRSEVGLKDKGQDIFDYYQIIVAYIGELHPHLRA